MVDIDQGGDSDPDFPKTVVIIDLCLDLIAELIISAGFVMDLFEDVFLCPIACQIRVSAFAFAE